MGISLSTEASLCCREAGEKEGRLDRKKKMARGGEARSAFPRALSIFRLLLFLL